MKRLILFFWIFGIVLGASAQKASLTKAYNFYYDKNYAKAKEAIDLCTQDDKLSGKAQTWLYKGNICYFLANEEYGAKQKDENFQILHPDAPVEAYDAFAKSMEINSNAEAMDMFSAKDALKQLYPLLLVRGVDQLIAKDYEGAKATLAKGIASYEMDKPQYPMNGDLYYYYAYTLEAMGDTKDLRQYYQKAIDDGSTMPYVYIRLAESYKKEQNKEMARKTLEQAKSKLPGNMGIAIAEIDFLYWSGDSAAAQNKVHSISPNQLKSADEFVNLANFYIKEKRYEEAVDLLDRANAMTPNDFVILYNLGVCHYSISEKLFNQYNHLAVSNPNDPAAMEYKTRSEQELTRSASFFEQARKLEPNDLNLLNTLKAIYARQQSPKYDEIDNIIKSLEK